MHLRRRHSGRRIVDLDTKEVDVGRLTSLVPVALTSPVPVASGYRARQGLTLFLLSTLREYRSHASLREGVR